MKIPDKIKNLYLDFETTSGDPKRDSLNPWRNCDILGFSYTFDYCPQAFYVPIAHKHGVNWDRNQALVFLIDLIKRSETWINHNVKYDVQVLLNNTVRQVHSHVMKLKLVDTIVGAKLLNSDMMYHGGYTLDNLSKKWLDKDISHLENAFAPYLYKNEDYAAIPADIMEPYAIQDVLTARELYNYIGNNLPPKTWRVWETEQKLTRVLVKIEQRGLLVQDQELRIEEFKARARTVYLEQKIHETIGRAINPSSSNDVFDTLITQFGLPILGWTEKGEASFDKYAMRRYLDLENLPETCKDVISYIAECRKLSTALTHFIEPYRELNIDGILHSSYNQVVRTGRMSSREPNSQQLDKATKALVHPRPGFKFVSVDLSQIEFRLIVHYLENEAAIRAYTENKDTDFHTLMAQMCGISRKSAKSLNFALGFGAGKAKTLAMLAAAGGSAEAEQIYNAYHANLPELKPNSRRATAAANARGYVQNLFGRRRHLPPLVAHIAFNSAVQSTAADILKDATVRLDEAIERCGLSEAIYLVASVHDETLFEISEDLCDDPRTIPALVRIIESQPAGIDLTVPIRSSTGVSGKSWAEAGADGNTRQIEHGPENILEKIQSDRTKCLTSP